VTSLPGISYLRVARVQTWWRLVAEVLLAVVWGISPFTAILCVLAALVEVVVGSVLFVQGTSDSRLARSRLRALATLPLPAARVVRSP